MREAADFVGDVPLIAHNASFDRKFWDAELARIRRKRKQEFACSMLVARRVFPNAPDHKLGTLAAYVGVKPTGRAHRALADAEMAAGLVLRMEQELIGKFNVDKVTHELLREIQVVPRYQLAGHMKHIYGQHGGLSRP
jgi:DNA polymerase-3 subunit epsilon